MKHTIYFKTQQEMLDYFPDGVVPNNFLAIIGDEESGKTVLFSSTNNIDGSSEEIGGYVDTPETKAELSYATEKTEDILVGQHTSTVEIQN